MVDVWGGSWGTSWDAHWAESQPAAVVEAPTGGGWYPPEEVKKLRRMLTEAEKRRQHRFREQRENRERFTRELEAIYDRATGNSPAVAERIVEIVRPAVRTEAAVPEPSQVDWGRVVVQAQMLRRLIDLLENVEKLDAAAQEEEILLAMVMV